MDDKGKFVALNALRGICALIIAFTFHYYCSFGQMPLSNVLEPLYEYGKYCVELFFLISGFLIYYRYGEKISEGGICFKDFIHKRLRRLYPIFFITTLVTALLIYTSVYVFSGDIGSNNLYHLLLSFLMLGSSGLEECQTFNTPSWYISVLFLMYILFYFIQKTAKMEKDIIAYSILSVIGIYIIHFGLPIRLPFLTQEMGRGYLNFSIGCLLCIGYKRYYQEKYKVRIMSFAISLIVLSALIVSLFSTNVIGDYYVVIGCIFSPSIFVLVMISKTVNSFFKFMHIDKLDKISYSLYLWHCPIYVFINLVNAAFHWNLEFASGRCYFFVIVTTLVWSILSYNILEKKIVTWKHRN